MVDTAQFSRMLQNDNEVAVNEIMSIIRRNIENYNYGKDKAKFLETKKKQIMSIFKKYDEEALKIFQRELLRINNKHNRQQSEKESAIENRSFVHKIKKNFDRSDSYSSMKSKNLGIIEA